MRLLTRQEFNEQVFKRDKHKCVFCKKPAVDAHHILDRKLFTDNGYYLDNGASVCEGCHLKCEHCEISVEDVREACGIRNLITPPEFSLNVSYDKWGRVNMIQKYARTMHLPWSPGATSDDKYIEHLDHFRERRVIITEKMDGENSSLYQDYFHARSLDGRHHPSRDWLKQYHATFSHDIPKGWRICGENMYARHSISYDDLPSYFLAFSVWDDRNVCLSWDVTKDWFGLLDLCAPRVLYDGTWDENAIKALTVPNGEGYVVRVAREFTYDEFSLCVGKFVRKNHVQTDDHWAHSIIVPNGLCTSKQSSNSK